MPFRSQAEDEAGESATSAGKGGALSTPLGVGEIADDLAALDKRCCDMCGITFFEFRNQGRLGCPHDYVQFERELEPLIANIHGATQHTGRRPSRPAVTWTCSRRARTSCSFARGSTTSSRACSSAGREIGRASCRERVLFAV